MKRIVFGFMLYAVVVAFFIYATAKQIHFFPPWVDILVGIGGLGVAITGLCIAGREFNSRQKSNAT